MNELDQLYKNASEKLMEIFSCKSVPVQEQINTLNTIIDDAQNLIEALQSIEEDT